MGTIYLLIGIITATILAYRKVEYGWPHGDYGTRMDGWERMFYLVPRIIAGLVWPLTLFVFVVIWAYRYIRGYLEATGWLLRQETDGHEPECTCRHH